MLGSLISLLGLRRARAAVPVIAPDILVDARNVGAGSDSYAPVQACIDFCNWCRVEAKLSVDEVAPDAWRCYFVDYYRAQVANGGHGQFAGNSGFKARELDFIAEGLQAMNAGEFLAVFQQFRTTLERDSRLRRAVMEGGGFGDIPASIQDLDRRFFALDQSWTLIELASTWVTTRPNWTPLPMEALSARRAAVLTAAGQRA